MYEIKQTKRSYRVKIDENLAVEFTPLMAGTDLALSQKQRRAVFLQKKVDTLQEAAKSEEEFNQVEKAMQEIDKLEAEVDAIIRGMFKPVEGQEKQLDSWLKSMSLSELIVAVKEIGEQTNGKTENGQPAA